MPKKKSKGPYLSFYQDSLNGCCGVGEVQGFGLAAYSRKDDEAYVPGTGLFIATYIDNEACRRAYEQLKTKHKLLFQSAPYFNYQNHVFICVYLHSKTTKDKLYPGRKR